MTDKTMNGRAVEPGELIEIDGGETRVVLAVGDDGRLHQIGFGVGPISALPGLPVGLYPLAYPTFGEEPLREPGLRVTHADGAVSTRLRVIEHHVDPRPEGIEHRIELVDRVAPLRVSLHYRTWPAYGIIEHWAEVTNTGDAPCTVHRAMATAPTIGGARPQLTHWSGGWAAEWTETTAAITHGTKTIASAGGVRTSLYAPPIVLIAPDGPATETEGIVGACTVVWGGDVRFDVESFLAGQVRVIAGAQDRGAERILEAGERFASPRVLWTWSTAGIGPTSRALHRFARDQLVRDGSRLRATVVNTWEALGFELTPAKLFEQVDRAAELGGELFLLDDGWFGTTPPRDDDSTSLGDWEVDRTKFPDGLQPVIDHTLERGLRFGLWVEPEMVNPDSTLYRSHPEWVIGEPGRQPREERNQLVLDLCRPEVQAFVIETIDRVLTEHDGITYLKWDANRDVTEAGSTTLAPDRQTHLALDRVRATWSVMDEVARRHPDVELMLCASGGGRSDLGTLRRFHELWTSDNTDPVDRVRIQWGASHLLPASVLAAHVTRWGRRPFAFACAVAMSGRFGFDVDLAALTDEESAIARTASADYAEIRELVQQGDLHRLVSPVGSAHGALAYVAPQRDRAVVFAYRTDAQGDGAPEEPPISLTWLDAGQTCELRELTPGRTESADGSTLDGNQLAWPEGSAPSARVVLLSSIRASS